MWRKTVLHIFVVVLTVLMAFNAMAIYMPHHHLGDRICMQSVSSPHHHHGKEPEHQCTNASDQNHSEKDFGHYSDKNSDHHSDNDSGSHFERTDYEMPRQSVDIIVDSNLLTAILICSDLTSLPSSALNSSYYESSPPFYKFTYYPRTHKLRGSPIFS